MVYVEQVVQGEVGLQIYVEQVEQGEGGRQIVVEQVEQGQGVCPAEPLHLFQSGSTRPRKFCLDRRGKCLASGVLIR